MKDLWLLIALLAPAAAASEFGERYPVGSIQDGVQAQAALKDAEAELARITKSAKLRDAECLNGFLVSSCRDDVRREKELAEREVKRVRVEARDVQRRVDADRVAKRRADEKAARAVEDARRSQKVSQALDAAKVREAEAKRREATATKEGEAAQAGPVQAEEQNRARQSPPRLTAEQRSENVRKFQQKQEQAQKRALEQEAKRQENEQRRAAKRSQIEQQEAAREEVRKRAAGSM